MDKSDDEVTGFWGLTRRRNKKHTTGIAFEKGLGKNGMNVACGMVMSILLEPCGAEVYDWNDSGNVV